MSNEKQKIEIELDQNKKLEISIIAKAFGITPGEFIKRMIKQNIYWIKEYLETDHPDHSFLLIYFGLEKINFKELREKKIIKGK